MKTRPPLAAPLLAFLLPLAAYLPTMARGLVWGDGIELAAVCASLGIAHPTGYPLFTLIGHAFSCIPVGSAYFRVALFCAVSVASASLLLFLLLRRWLTFDALAEEFPEQRTREVLALAGALTFAWSLPVWRHATAVEVYAFELLFQLGMVILSFAAFARPSRRGLALLALLFGLGMAHHLMTLALAPLLLAAALKITHAEYANSDPARARLPRAIPWKTPLLAAGAFFLGLAPLLYLPLRAAQSPALNWGDPSSIERFMWTLRGGEFGAFRFLAERPGVPFSFDTYLEFFMRRVGELIRYLAGAPFRPSDPADPLWAIPVLLAFAALAAGAWRLWKLQRQWLLALACALALHAFFLFTYNIPDIADYQLGFLALLWPVAWLGVVEAVRRAASAWRRLGEPRRAVRVAWLLLALPIAAAFANYRHADRSADVMADLYAARLFSDDLLPPNAILITAGDSDIYSAWYMQEVENQRPDVLVFGGNFIFSPWYDAYFRGRDLKGRRVGTAPGRPTTDVAFVRALETHIIEPNMERFPIFTTLDEPALRARHRLEPVAFLLTPPEYRAAAETGLYPPPPVLYRIDLPPPTEPAPAPGDTAPGALPPIPSAALPATAPHDSAPAAQ